MSFLFKQKVLFKHCDPAGIVFYPRYFEMLNDCVEAFFAEALAWPFEAIHPTSSVPTARIETTFTAPSRHGDALEITLTPTRIGHSSLDLAYAGRAEDKTRFTATSTLVHVGPGGRPEAWPAAPRAILENMIGKDADER